MPKPRGTQILELYEWFSLRAGSHNGHALSLLAPAHVHAPPLAGMLPSRDQHAPACNTELSRSA